jgi:hypothetical protein
MKKLLFLLPLLVCFSCKKNILDLSPQNAVSDAAVWTDANLIGAYQVELYNAIPHGFYIHMYSKMTDEAVNTAPCCGADIFGMNPLNSDNVAGAGGGDYWGGYMYYYNQGFQYIRKVNVFLEHMATTTVALPNKARMIAEAKFIRAYAYFLLIERFGGMPIITQSYPLGDLTQFKRNTYDECVAFIKSDLAAAMPDLPVSYASTDGSFGRATQDASKALLSRVTLYAASKLNNPSHDATKWQAAADAAAALLNSGYSLYPNYRSEFNLSSGQANSEVIFAREFTTSNGQEAPANNLGRRYGAYGGWWASNGPSQNLVDDYDMANGQPAFIYPGGVKTVNTASGYDPQNPYANRDPRFEATVIHDGSVYHGDTFAMWIAQDGNTWGFDSYKQSSDNPTDNYELRKFMPEDPNIPISFQTVYTTPWIHFRLAEIYLNYAEAKFELGDETTARQYINLVRARAGMPGIDATVTGDDLRRRLYNERRIELAFESHRFFDVRRWMIGATAEGSGMYGMSIIKNTTTNVKTYTPVLLLKRPWFDQYNLLPIDRSEVKRNPLFIQNPGY